MAAEIPSPVGNLCRSPESCMFWILPVLRARKIGLQSFFSSWNGKTAKLPHSPHSLSQALSPEPRNHQLQRGEDGGGGEGERTHHAPLFQALTLFAEHPVQAGVRCGGKAAGEADRFR